MAKLYRSRTDTMVAGVASGLGQYLMVDPTWVRLLFVLLFFINGAGFWIYALMSLVVPRVPEGEEIIPTDQPIQENPEVIKIVGGTLVLFGLLSLLGNLNLVWLSWFTFSNLWPILLILAGSYLLFRTFRKEE